MKRDHVLKSFVENIAELIDTLLTDDNDPDEIYDKTRIRQNK